MTIFKEIYDLLYNNDCVIVPKFGAFVLKNHSAYIRNYNFYPPRKIISFNAMLDENDGLLVKYLSTSRNISYKKALKIGSWRISLLGLDIKNIKIKRKKG